MTPLCLAVLVCSLWSFPVVSPDPTPASSQAEAGPADPRIDKGTGRQNATWRKDQPIDYTHLKLEVDFPDAAVATMTGVVFLEGKVRGMAVPVIMLDCDGPMPIAAAVDGVGAAWVVEGKQIRIRPSAPLQPGSVHTVQIKYTLEFGSAKGEGLTLSPPPRPPHPPTPDVAGTSATDASPVIHAQGQAELNSRWFPCPDTPAERLTSEVLVTVETGLETLSNGTLLGTRSASAGSLGQARTTWHWTQRQPHAPYLITLVVGDFAVLELGGAESARPGLAMPLYVPHGSEEFARSIFANTPAMVAFLEERFGEPYPWDKYAQAVVRGFRWGGMENTSATVLTTKVLDRGTAEKPVDLATFPQDDLIVHELAHQWTGNLVTCRHWDHTWLNEGWATYCEALWAQHLAGMQGMDASTAREAYLGVVEAWLRDQIVHNHGSSPAAPAIGSNRYANPDDVIDRKDDPYAKGALVLHMLAEMVGEEAFWKGTRAYIQRWKFGHPETADFRREIEAASGRSLERFFEQWLLRPGFPRLRTRATWDDTTNHLVLAIEQVQVINALNPAYELRVPVVLTLADGSTRTESITFDTRRTEMRILLAARPVSVAFDPDLSLMASMVPRGVDLVTGAEIPSELEAPPTTDLELGKPVPVPAGGGIEVPIGVESATP
jgi:aminopeptidase N